MYKKYCINKLKSLQWEKPHKIVHCHSILLTVSEYSAVHPAILRQLPYTGKCSR